MMMKQLKILVLAAVAATALMATMGIGTASATETAFCKMKETQAGLPRCAGGNLHEAGKEVHGVLKVGTNAVVETPLGKAECGESTFGFFSEKQTAIPLGAIVSGFTFAECGEYTIKVLLNTVDIEIIDLPVWTHNGTITATSGEVEVKKGGAECVYSIGHIGSITGGKPAIIDLTGTLTRIGGNLMCPAGNGKWSASYVDTGTEAVWISM
jgi:hypothetical protein